LNSTEPDPGSGQPRPVTVFEYNDAGEVVRMLDPLNAGTSNWTIYGIDVLGRTYAQQSADPDGVGPELSPFVYFYYDARGRMTATQEAIGAVDGPGTDDQHLKPDTQFSIARGRDQLGWQKSVDVFS
jgi:hypothetical protein